MLAYHDIEGLAGQDDYRTFNYSHPEFYAKGQEYLAVGMHAKTGSVGFASHTVTIGMGLWMNGRSITETEIVAFSWGRVGVPVIFVSGDDHLQRDLVTMPWLQFVVTKWATSANTVQLRNVEAVHA